MGNSITQKIKYKQSVIKFSKKYGVYKAAVKFNEWPKTIYRWKEKYDGSLESLKVESSINVNIRMYEKSKIRMYIFILTFIQSIYF